MRQIQGRLTAFGFTTTQGQWTFDVSAVTGAAAAQPSAGPDARPQPSAPPQPPGARDADVVKNIYKPPTRSVQQSHAESSRARDLPQSDDDDAFMDPPPWHPVAKKQCINASVAAKKHGKPLKNPVKYAHAPTARCAPSTFNSFVDHLTFEQRRRIQAMGFGGLLRVSAERLESRELLKFLFDRLDPKTMVINVTKDKVIHVTPFAVKQVLDIPDYGKDICFHTHTQASKAFSAFKTSVGLEESQDLHASHLQKILEDDHKLGSCMIDDDMAIRFFFIIASNKLLFPSTDNNIRCKDVYLTRDLSSLPGFNWCKAVVDDLREAAVTWKADKAKKSLSGCAILLIILYLDNLQCKHQVAHTNTPRAKYFDQNVIKKIIAADRTKDQQGKATFGLLPLRKITNTCYHMTQHPSSHVPPSIQTLPATHLPCMQAELRGLVAQICSMTRKTQAMLALANFDAKAKKALSYVNIGQQILRDAHQAAVSTLQAILNEEELGNNSEYHHDQDDASDAVQAHDVDMYDSHSVDKLGSEHLSDVPIDQSETMDNHLSSGAHTNQEFNQGAPVELQQNRNQGQVLPDADAVHQAGVDTQAYPNENVVDDKEMEADLSPICTQAPTDVTIDHVVPPVAAEAYTGPASPVGSTHDNAANAAADLDSLVDLIDASTTATIHPQEPAVDAVSHTYNQGTDDPQQSALMGTAMLPLAGVESTKDDALGPVLVYPSTQDETLNRPTLYTRPQRLTKRPAMYVSPFKGDPQRAKVPMSKAHAIRKKFHIGMKCSSDVFIRAGWKEFSGDDILDSFLDNKKLSTQFMSYFVACMSHDESNMADGGGYRVFLSQELGEYINIEEDEDYSQWESHHALTVLQRDLADLDPTKVKLFFLPVMEEEHYSIYCINFIHDRIDVLDSSPDMEEYHQVLGDRIIKRLNLLFQLETDGAVKQFTRFKRPLIDVCVQSHYNDSGFLAIKFMELWNGEYFHVPILAEKTRQYRSQLLFYGLYHQINEIKKLPAGLEALRPRP